ncbi:long-chain fatty acid--CoA ligase [Actinocorallia aurea]
MSMPAAVRFWAVWRPDGIALRFGEENWTWRRLDAVTNEIAAGLARAGVTAGDRVGIFSENRPEWCQTALAAGKIRAVTVPLNVRMTAAELRFTLEHSGCRLVVVDDAHAERAATAVEGLPDVTVVTLGEARDRFRPFADLVAAGAPDPGQVPDEEELAYLCFTSGTTGRPKAAMITHGNVSALAMKNGLADGLTWDDSSYLPTSLSFTGSVLTVWAPIAHAGGTLVLAPGFDPAETVARLSTDITVFYGPVPLWAAMAEVPGIDERDFSGLRLARAGAGPVPPAQLTAWQARGITLGQGYGCTESSGSGIMLPPADAIARSGSVGRPLMGTQVRVVAEDGRDCDVDEVGELLMRGPEVMAGYWRDEAETRRVLADGWLRTGDLAARDADGYLRIVDRKKDMFVSGGLNVYPAEVERVIGGIPGVAGVAVVARPDARWGEVGVAFVDADPGRITAEAVLAAVRAELSDYKVPRSVVVERDALPRTMSGKVMKPALKERALTDPAARP